MNILDYLDWRGDLTFAASGPNEVDALIFAWLIYYRFEDFLDESFDGMTLAELAALHERVRGPFRKINPATTIDPAVTSGWLLRCVSRTERFASVRVCDFLRRQSGEDPARAERERTPHSVKRCGGDFKDPARAEREDVPHSVKRCGGDFKDSAQTERESAPGTADGTCPEYSGLSRAADAGEDIQFAAASFILEDGDGEVRVIAYRGTDDSIAGWKEDCCLAVSDTVPAQETGLRYLEDTADGRRALLCGHSKGGNLAVYAALFASEERMKDITSVYNFDGPGFCFDMRDTKRYDRIRERIVTIVPESSIVGMLLEHGNEYRVVKSQGAGLLQHDALFWQVLGNKFVYTDKRNESSFIADKALRAWIDGMSVGERREFIDALFGILEGTGAVRTTELPEKLVQNGFRNLVHSPADRRQKKLVFQVLLKLIRLGNESLYDSVIHSDTVKELTEHVQQSGRRERIGKAENNDAEGNDGKRTESASGQQDGASV